MVSTHLDKIIAQSTLICANRIETTEQLSIFVEKTKSQIDEYASLRKEIQTILRRRNTPANSDELICHKDELTKQINTADGIKGRSEKMKQNLDAINQGGVMKKQKEQQQEQRKSRSYER